MVQMSLLPEPTYLPSRAGWLDVAIGEGATSSRNDVLRFTPAVNYPAIGISGALMVSLSLPAELPACLCLTASTGRLTQKDDPLGRVDTSATILWCCNQASSTRLVIRPAGTSSLIAEF